MTGESVNAFLCAPRGASLSFKNKVFRKETSVGAFEFASEQRSALDVSMLQAGLQRKGDIEEKSRSGAECAQQSLLWRKVIHFKGCSRVPASFSLAGETHQ